MSWSAHIQHTPQGLALTFPEPLSRLDMTSDVAAHLASLLAVEARRRMVGVVEALVAVPVALDTRHAHFCDCLDCMGSSDA